MQCMQAENKAENDQDKQQKKIRIFVQLIKLHHYENRSTLDGQKLPWSSDIVTRN